MIKNASIATLAMFLSAASPAMATSDAHSLYVNLELALNQTTVGTVIRSISEQTGYEFSYDETLLNKKISKVSVNLKNEHIENVLKEVFKNTGISYKIVNNRVFLKDDSVKKIKRSEFAQNGVQQEKHTISGRIVDKEGLAIIGANVTLEDNKGIGTITDVDGKFVLNGISNGAILLISYIGYIDQKIKIDGGQNSYQITLLEDTQKLDEVIVIGYGVEKKVNLTGAITNVKTEELSTISTTNLSNTLAGRAPGLTIVGSSGFMGASSEIRMRGGFGDPLFVIDGIIRDKAAFDALEPNEIDQLSFLKDAATASVYGSKAGNGVVLVTTKSGADAMGKPKFEYQGSYTFNRPTRKLFSDEMSAYKELVYQNLVAEANGLPLPNNEEEMEYAKTHDYNVNDLIWQNPWNTKHSISATGGTEKVKYYVAGSYYKENGVFRPDKGLGYNPASSWSRFNFRSNLDINLFKNTVLNINLSNQYDVKKQPNNNASLWIYTFKTIPIAIPKKYSDGTVARPTIGDNPYNLLNLNGYNELFTNNAQSLIGLTQDFSPWIKGLKANIKFSWDAYNYAHLNRSKNPSTYYATGRNEDGNLMYTKNNDGNDYLVLYKDNKGNRTTYLEASLTYENLFANAHRVGGLFLFNMREKTDNFPDSYIMSLPYRNQGIAGRVTYSYKDRYFIEGNFGYNGSENFAPKKRFGFFPSAAIGYMISNEAFWEPISHIVSVLKFKGSYGIIGNDQIGGNRRFAFNSEMADVNGYTFGTTGGNPISGIGTGYPGNPYVSWEEAKKMNIGVELELYNSLKLNVDYFHERRSGIFIERGAVPSVVGVNVNPYLNLGEMENKGVDASLEYYKTINKDWNISVRGNFTYNRNKKLYDDQPSANYPYKDVIGKPWNQQFGYIALGYFRTESEIQNSPKQIGNPRVGDLKYKDINGDGIVDTDDYVAIGRTAIPEINYGFGANISYKDFDVAFFFQGIGNVTGFIGGETIDMSDTNQLFSNVYQDVALNYWRPDRPNAKYPRLAISGSENNKAPSTHNQVDKSFMRLKSAEIGYTLPKEVCHKMGISLVRFYVSGTNLLTFSKFKLWDPEIDNSQGSSYPNMRVFNIGLNFNF